MIFSTLGPPDGGESLIGQTFLVAGWCRVLRRAQKDTIGFIRLSDGSIHTPFQILIEQNCEGWESVESNKLTHGCSLQIIGKLVASPVKNLKVELIAKEVVMLGNCPADVYPLGAGRNSLEYLRTIGHLRPRTNTVSLLSTNYLCNDVKVDPHSQHQL